MVELTDVSFTMDCTPLDYNRDINSIKEMLMHDRMFEELLGIKIQREPITVDYIPRKPFTIVEEN